MAHTRTVGDSMIMKRTTLLTVSLLFILVCFTFLVNSSAKTSKSSYINTVIKSDKNVTYDDIVKTIEGSEKVYMQGGKSRIKEDVL